MSENSFVFFRFKYGTYKIGHFKALDKHDTFYGNLVFGNILCCVSCTRILLWMKFRDIWRKSNHLNPHTNSGILLQILVVFFCVT
jgi:hypothetical protein